LYASIDRLIGQAYISVTKSPPQEGINMERIDKLGTYFIYHNIKERFDITFETFVTIVDSGRWEEVVEDGTSQLVR
jgi:predicted RNA-binding protein (virulence factor B family)